MKLTLKRPPKERKGNGEGFEPWADGKYRVLIEDAVEVEDQYGGLKLTVKAIGGDYDGQTRILRVFPNSEAVRTLVDIAGEDSEQQEIEFEPTTLVGFEVNLYLGSREKGGKTFNVAKKFSAAPKKGR